MRSVLALAGLVASASAATVSVPVTRRSHAAPSLTKRDGSLDLKAVNNITGGGYYAEFKVGTPGQTISFLLDTGSSDTWVNSANADVCTNPQIQEAIGGSCMATFDYEASSTFQDVNRVFDITYLDGRNIQGEYFNDTVTFGDGSIENQQLGLALESVRPTGIMGLGFSANVAARRPYATVIDNMVSQGLISTAAFSLYLNDLDADDGTILFGGVDSEKFIGNLTTLPLQADPQSLSSNITSFTINMDGFAVNAPSGSDQESDAKKIDSFQATTILDSGSTICLLPSSVAEGIWDLFDVKSMSGVTSPFIDCAWREDKGSGFTFDFQFSGKNISVPIREMVIDAFPNDQDAVRAGDNGLFDDFDSICLFGIASASDFGVDSDDWAILGDTFLRSAYVVYDLENEQLGLAQANLNSDKSNVVEFNAKTKDIPDVSGVDSDSADDGSTADSGNDDDNAAGVLSPPVFTVVILIGAMMALL